MKNLRYFLCFLFITALSPAQELTYSQIVACTAGILTGNPTGEVLHALDDIVSPRGGGAWPAGRRDGARRARRSSAPLPLRMGRRAHRRPPRLAESAQMRSGLGPLARAGAFRPSSTRLPVGPVQVARLDGGGDYLRRTLPYRTLQEKVEGVAAGHRLVKDPGFLNALPTLRRTSTALTSGWYRSTPWYESVPSTRAISMRSFMRLKQRRTVVLPQPEGPMKAVTWCWRTFRRATPRPTSRLRSA